MRQVQTMILRRMFWMSVLFLAVGLYFSGCTQFRVDVNGRIDLVHGADVTGLYNQFLEICEGDRKCADAILNSFIESMSGVN